MAGIFLFITFLLQISVIKCDGGVKGSLTFVIDDTGSMGDDIAQVKESANQIFDTVLENKHSPIENFILVTFNDPDVRPATITRDREIFKRALNNIIVDGGADCPEYSMSGIESALKESLPRSYLYVFTDASAKDYHKYEQVKSLAMKKSSQVVFVLTGSCGSKREPDEQVYYDLADATMGQVFHLEKDSVKDILDYVKESIKGSSTVLSKEKLPPGYGHTIEYPTDEHIKDVIISATGDKPKVKDVTDPEGSKPDVETIFDKDGIVIVKVPETKPGVYKATVGSKGDTTVVITGRTTIDFQHGFSTFKPTSIKDTVTRPQRDVESYLSIKLNIIEGGDVKLTHVKIVDIAGKSILEEPLEVLNDKQRLYVTNPIRTPDKMFRIMVIGYAVADNSTITRQSPTLIEPQKPELEIKEPRAPKITIDGGTKVSVDYNAPLKLSCKVNAYPKPDVIWIEESSGSLLPSTVADVEPPYEYISLLEIDKVNKNATYTCKATNPHGMDSKSIAVEIPVYFITVENPKDTVVKYNTMGVFLCKIDASPPAKITWYRNGNVLIPDDKTLLSADGSVLTIPKMEPRLQGHYTCDASNDLRTESFKFKVAISGVESPKIDKHSNKIHVTKGSDPELICRITQGIPPPRFVWYFKRHLTERFRKLWSVYSNKISFKNITTLEGGVYKCMAFNDLGHDMHDTELVVEYPPTIKESAKFMNGKAGEELTLTCDVDGVPSSIVNWMKDDIIVKNSPKTPIYRDNSLRLKLSVEDSGTYKCQASNRLGKVTKEINLDVYVPAHIEPPRETPVNIKLGDNEILICDAYGIPMPEIKWIFHDKDGKKLTKPMTDSESTDFVIRRAQFDDAGYYTCIATNAGGSFNVTYDVRVNAPPYIENVYKDKTFRPVEGDVVLMIQCKATGSPKPSITWTKDGMDVASGTMWYDIDEHGTLFIKNVDREATGTYVCRADNVLGRDAELFYVAVDPYPREGSPTSNLLIEQGSTSRVECPVAHDLVDSLRWYKDRRLIKMGELTISGAKLSDSGLYTCRVSNHMTSISGYTKLTIGYKPKFTTDEEENVELVEGYLAELVCTSQAEPQAKTTWWHNGILLNVTSPEHLFDIKMSDHGNFTCEASNEFGKIQRTFHMRSRDCVLSVKDDFVGNQPVMFSSPVNWPSYEVVNGNMIMTRSDYISLYCPTSFTKFPSQYISAFCNGEDTFIVKGITYKFSDLKCNSAIEPSISSSGEDCLGDGTEMVTIDFNVLDTFLQAYEVCYDKDKKLPIYTKHKLERYLSNMEPKAVNWISTDLWPINSDELYDCNNQVNKISRDLRTWFHAADRCCFRKRQLINPRDLNPGLLQTATYTYLNVVPQWSTCNINNWDDVEQRLRDLAKSVDYSLNVWTGTFKHLQLAAGSSGTRNINIGDLRGTNQAVPHYLWKVIQDPVTRSSLAVVQINVPDLKTSEAFEHILCGDVCNDITWMRGGEWHDVSKGYIYCCNIRDFERAFGFDGVFDRGHDRLFTGVSFLPAHSLT